jgi:HSP20 family protein
MRLRAIPEFDRLFDQMGSLGGFPSGVMPMDVFRKDDEFVIKFDLPGAHPENLTIEVEDGTLTIEAERAAENVDDVIWVTRERPHGKHSRTIKLGRALDSQAVSANYDQGVLTVTIPVKPEAKPKKISVDISRDRVLEATASS